MAADPTLARGAYLAARNDDSATKSAMRYLSSTLAKGSEKLRKKSVLDNVEDNQTASPKSDPAVDKNITTDLENEINHKDTPEGQAENLADEAISSGEFDGPTQEANELNQESLEESNARINEAIQEGDNATEGALLKNLDDELINQENLHEAFANHSTDWTNRSKEQGNIHTPHGYGMALDKDKEAKAWVIDMTTNPNRVVTMEKQDSEGKVIGFETGVIGPNGDFLNGQQLKDKLAEYEVDNESFLAFNDLASGFKQQALDADPKSTFDHESARLAVTDIINKGNMRSLKYDANFGGTSFAEDLKRGDLLAGKRYADLGIDPPASDDDGIVDVNELTQEDKDSVVDAYLESDSDVLQAEIKENLINYFTEHTRRNWMRGNIEVRARHDMSEAQPVMDDYAKFQKWRVDNPNGSYADYMNEGWNNPEVNYNTGNSGELPTMLP